MSWRSKGSEIERVILEILTVDYTNEVLHRLRTKGSSLAQSDPELLWPTEHVNRYLQIDLVQSTWQDKASTICTSAGKFSVYKFLLEYELTELFSSQTGVAEETGTRSSCKYSLRNALCGPGLDKDVAKI